MPTNPPTCSVTFIPLIVAHRPTESPYQEAPHGTDMAMLRIVPATDVRAGDLVLGAFDGPLNPNRLRWAMQSAPVFVAIPIRMWGAVCLDGQTPNWEPDELIMVIPRELRPADRYTVGDRVERTVVHTPPLDYAGRQPDVRLMIQRGTVTAVDDGALSIAWDGRWPNAEIPDTGIRPVDHLRVERSRAATGFAVGDRVTRHDGTTTGVVMELCLHWYNARSLARVDWPGVDDWDTRVVETSSLVHALPAAPVAA
ncbi:hypothetical protein [Streptomyces sp. NPDC004267]|uniref:hypothetical protein n=1 Tax=Streptomyces sp. NPDC004267 TaxID=3364694 RepID=UPI003691F0B5